MRIISRFRSILNWIVNRRRAEAALDDELRTFVEMSAAERMRDGVPAEQARREAILELGGIEQAKERVHTYRHGGGLDEVGRDVRYAIRMFARTPGFTAVVVTTLALGIGANTAIFSLIDALMLRTLPVKSPSELVQVAFQPPTPEDEPGTSFSYPIARALAERHEIFSGVAGFSSFGFEVGPPDGVVRVPGAMVTGGYYDTLGLSPVAGRLLTPEDDQPGAALVAVISDGYWERQYARAYDAVGKIIQLNNQPVTIVGISPRGFVGANVGHHADITMALAALPQTNPSAAPLLERGNFWLRILARPQPGVTVAEATARLNAAWPQMADAVIAPHWPVSRRQQMARSVFQLLPGATGWSYFRNLYNQPLTVMMVVVGVVLLIACANVASLLFARASARQKELAVRLAIGAGRLRIVRQLLIESLVLALAGAACGIGLAWLTSRSLLTLISNGPGDISLDLSPNWQVLGFTSALAVLTALVFGLAPALSSTAIGPAATLKEDARVGSARSRLLPSLVCLQVAMSLALLAAAGLFVRTLQNLQVVERGFRARNVVLVDAEGWRVNLPADVLDDVRRIPGVMVASIATHTPLSGASWSDPAVPMGQEVPERDNALFVGAGVGFFDALQVRILSGRTFENRDGSTAPAVAIVNEAYAARHFAGENPVGQQLSAKVRGEHRDLEIVGVATNVKASNLRAPASPTVYVPYAQLSGDLPATIVARVSAAMGTVAPAIQRTIQARVPGVLVDVKRLSEQVDSTLAQERLLATLAGGFGILALTITCVGLYGLLGYAVSQRTKELGIRLALGAQPPRVVAMVLSSGMRLVAIGVAIGLPAAWLGSRYVESMLFGLAPTDPLTIAGAIAMLFAAAQLAAYLPARRASRVDPLVALRHE